jgi:hypothetical protein
MDTKSGVVIHEPLLQFFVLGGLAPKVAQPFDDLALRIVETLPRNAERTVALRKLLEARDAALRASVAVDVAPPPRAH